MWEQETVASVQACRAAVAILEKEDFVAVDCEGVNLSATGPLTLLQTATARGQVYLFDVMREPRMFQDGGLKGLLEGQSVVKVMHSARNDGEALFAQFGVELRNVHDTQLATMELDRSEGTKLSRRKKLVHVVEAYCPEKAKLLQQKTDVQTKWNKADGEYWAKRPLTQEMIHYAANDVVTIVPEVYLAQKKQLTEKGLADSFRLRVQTDIKSRYDKDGKESVEVRRKIEAEEKQLTMSVLHEFAASASKDTQYKDIKDDSVLTALDLIRWDVLEYLPPLVRDLKMQKMEIQLCEIEEEMEIKGDDFEPSGMVRGVLAACGRHLPAEDNMGALKKKAQRLEKAVHKIIVRGISTKYTEETPLKHIAAYEKAVLWRLQPKGEHDPTFHPVLLKLYWEDKLEWLAGEMRTFLAHPDAFPVSEGRGIHKYLTAFVTGDVPAALKRMAQQFLRDLQSAGKVATPTSTTEEGEEVGSEKVEG